MHGPRVRYYNFHGYAWRQKDHVKYLAAKIRVARNMSMDIDTARDFATASLKDLIGKRFHCRVGPLPNYQFRS